MSEEATPAWAIPLVKLVERIDQKLDGHNIAIGDHESRLRDVEATQAAQASLAAAQTKLDESLIEVFGRLRALEKKVWIAVGAITIIGGALGLFAFNININ
jgi:hypothetical protein